MQPQPQHRSICGRWLIRVFGGRFHRCGRVSARGCRADSGRDSSAHIIPKVANQPGTVSDSTDFENPNNDKLFQEKEGPDRLSMLVETPLEFLHFFSDKEFKSIVEQSNRSYEEQSNNVADDRWKDITVAEIKEFMGYY